MVNAAPAGSTVSLRTVLGGLLLALLLGTFYYSKETEETLVELPLLGGSINLTSVYSETYQDARQAFRTAAAAVGAEQTVLPILLTDDEEYTMDIALLRGSLPGLVVHVSGTHGVEGYAGSAIQVAFLKGLRLESNPPERPTILLVHAFNPVGMAKFRRTNEHNVDLNRNALTDHQWNTYAANHYNRAAYDQFDSLFNRNLQLSSETWWSSLKSFYSVYLQLGYDAVTTIVSASQGMETLKAAMVGGQYHNQTSIFYGGNERETSINVLSNFLVEQNITKLEEGGAVTWIDVHTGLGRPGHDTLLAKPRRQGASIEKLGEELTRWFPDSGHPFGSDKAAASVNQGYDQVEGMTVCYYEEMFPEDSSTLFFAQEFGTRPSIGVGHAFVVENAAYQSLPKDQALTWAKRTTKWAFYPNGIAWKQSIVERGVRVFMQAVERSKVLSKAT